MTREEFARFLEKLRKADEKGENTDAIVKSYEKHNVYFYNDACIKKILASEKNIALTTDLINAALDLVGPNRIEHPKLVNPFIPGDLGYRNSEPDLLLTNDRDDVAPRDRISIEIQHDGDTIYKHRVVLYVSRHISNMVKKNAPPVLENLNLISFQFTDAFPWNHSKNYRHSVQFYNQEKLLYFEPLMITVVEVNKFFGHADVFASDRSRLAQWLRAIDTLNREADFAEFVTDPVFRVLQEEVKLCNFSSRYLMTDEMKSIDNAMIEFRGREKVARNLLKFGLDPKIIAQNTELPLYWVINLKKEMELVEV
jgi:hypothetical protein